MNDELRELLEDVVKDNLTKLGTMDILCDERAAIMNELDTFYNFKLSEDKICSEMEDKKSQSKEQIKDRYLKCGVEIAGIILPLIFYAVWMKQGFKFEESGTYTSTTFRGLFSKFKPTKK